MASLIGDAVGGVMFKSYYTLPEAARYLASELNEDLTEIDLLLAAKRGDLILSLVFQEPPLCLITSKIDNPTEEEIRKWRSCMCLDWVGSEAYRIEVKRILAMEEDGLFDIENLGDAAAFFGAELVRHGYPSTTTSLNRWLSAIEMGGIYFKRKDCDGYFKPATFTPLYPPPKEPADTEEEAAWEKYRQYLYEYSLKEIQPSFWIHDYPKTFEELPNASLVVRKENFTALIKDKRFARVPSQKTINKQNVLIAVMAQMITGKTNASKSAKAGRLVDDIQKKATALGWKAPDIDPRTLQKYIEEGEEILKQ